MAAFERDGILNTESLTDATVAPPFKTTRKRKKPCLNRQTRRPKTLQKVMMPQAPAPSLYDKLPELRRLDQMVERAVATVKRSYGFEPAKATSHYALNDLIRQTTVTMGDGVRLYRLAKQSEAAQ